MKNLKEYIKESILGDWEDIDIKNDAIESVINSYEFKKVFNYYMGYIEYDYKTDTLMCTEAEIEYLNGKTLMDYLPSVKNIYAKNHIYIDIDNSELLCS